jgi:hypothetical protein
MLIDQELLRYLFRNSGFGPKIRSEIIQPVDLSKFEFDGKIILSPGLTLEYPGNKCITKNLLSKKLKDVLNDLFVSQEPTTDTYISRIDHVRRQENLRSVWTNNSLAYNQNYQWSKDILITPRYKVGSKTLLVFYNDMLVSWGDSGTYVEIGAFGVHSQFIQLNVEPKLGDRVSCVVYDVETEITQVVTSPFVCPDGTVLYDSSEKCPDNSAPLDCGLLENADNPLCACDECAPPPPEDPPPEEPPPPPEDPGPDPEPDDPDDPGSGTGTGEPGPVYDPETIPPNAIVWGDLTLGTMVDGNGDPLPNGAYGSVVTINFLTGAVTSSTEGTFGVTGALFTPGGDTTTLTEGTSGTSNWSNQVLWMPAPESSCTSSPVKVMSPATISAGSDIVKDYSGKPLQIMFNMRETPDSEAARDDDGNIIQSSKIAEVAINNGYGMGGVVYSTNVAVDACQGRWGLYFVNTYNYGNPPDYPRTDPKTVGLARSYDARKPMYTTTIYQYNQWGALIGSSWLIAREFGVVQMKWATVRKYKSNLTMPELIEVYVELAMVYNPNNTEQNPVTEVPRVVIPPSKENGYVGTFYFPDGRNTYRVSIRRLSS